MAEKYTEPLWRAGARFSATPGDGGWAPRMGISRAQPTRSRQCLIGPCPPAGDELQLPYVHERRTFAEISRIVIENPTNHPISKQSVISLVRIICIERTWNKNCPLRTIYYGARAPVKREYGTPTENARPLPPIRRPPASRARVNSTEIV